MKSYLKNIVIMFNIGFICGCALPIFATMGLVVLTIPLSILALIYDPKSTSAAWLGIFFIPISGLLMGLMYAIGAIFGWRIE